jgi:excisionase family DNA binding protein
VTSSCTSHGIAHVAPDGGIRLLLSPREAAAALSISERTLWALTKAGRIRAVRIGRSVRYHVADLEAYIATLKDGGPQS